MVPDNVKDSEPAACEHVFVNCKGGLIVHVDEVVAGCTLDDENGCAGIELRHEDDPEPCWRYWGGCARCGIVV